MNNDDAKFLVTEFKPGYETKRTYFSNWTMLLRHCKNVKKNEHVTKIRVHRQLTESEYEKLEVSDIVEQYNLS